MSEAGEALAARLDMIEPLPDADRSAVAALPGEILHAEAGESFVRMKGRVGCLVVLDGLLCHASSAGGKRQLLSFYIRSDLPKLGELFVDEPGSEVIALTACTVGVVAREELLHLVDERPAVRRQILVEGGLQSAIARQWLIRNSALPSVEACAHLTCELLLRSSALGLTKGDAMDFPIGQQDLSDALGITIIHMNRTLQRLKRTGLISTRSGRLFVHDWQALTEFAKFDPSYLAPLFSRPSVAATT